MPRMSAPLNMMAGAGTAYFFGGVVGFVLAFLPVLLPFCSVPDMVFPAGFDSLVAGGVFAA